MSANVDLRVEATLERVQAADNISKFTQRRNQEGAMWCILQG